MTDVKLPKRPLGKTGLQLSVIGFGAGVLGGAYKVWAVASSLSHCGFAARVWCLCENALAPASQDVNVQQDTATAAVHSAFDAGINWYDTSPFYGLGQSETVSGSCRV
jgi:L-galactose dehydrogenase